MEIFSFRLQESCQAAAHSLLKVRKDFLFILGKKANVKFLQENKSGKELFAFILFIGYTIKVKMDRGFTR